MSDVVTEDNLRELVTCFYGKVRRHPRLGPIFNAHVEDWDAHVERLTLFWSSLMLTPGRYKGNPFAAHQKLSPGLNETLFDDWLKLFGEAAEERFSPEISTALRSKSERIAASLRAGLLFRPQTSMKDSSHQPARPAALSTES